MLDDEEEDDDDDDDDGGDDNDDDVDVYTYVHILYVYACILIFTWEVLLLDILVAWIV